MAAEEAEGDGYSAGRPRARPAGDPRGGVQRDEYRHADPRALVEEDATVMAGDGGAPREGESADERRERDRGARGT